MPNSRIPLISLPGNAETMRDLGGAIDRLGASALEWKQRALAAEKALSATVGYMTNAVLDLQGRTPKQTTIDTLNGGIALARAALSKAEA